MTSSLRERARQQHARTSAPSTDDAPRPIIRAFVLTPRLKVALWMLFWLGVAILAGALAMCIAFPNEGGVR